VNNNHETNCYTVASPPTWTHYVQILCYNDKIILITNSENDVSCEKVVVQIVSFAAQILASMCQTIQLRLHRLLFLLVICKHLLVVPDCAVQLVYLLNHRKDRRSFSSTFKYNC